MKVIATLLLALLAGACAQVERVRLLPQPVTAAALSNPAAYAALPVCDDFRRPLPPGTILLSPGETLRFERVSCREQTPEEAVARASMPRCDDVGEMIRSRRGSDVLVAPGGSAVIRGTIPCRF